MILALLAAGPALAQDAAATTALAAFDPDELYVESITQEGASCPQGSFSYNIAPNAGHLTLLFADFRLDAAANAAPVTSTCRIELQVHAPTGWSFAPSGVEIIGFAQLPADTTASHQLALVQGARRRVTLASSDMKGPLQGDYRFTAQAPADLWSPCSGRPANDGIVKLTLASETRLAGAHGTLRGASLDGELRQRLKLAWRRCTPHAN